MATAKLRVVLLAAIVAVAAGSRADAHESADAHQRQDAVTHTPSEERALERRTEVLTDADADRAAARAVGTPDQVGSWGPVLDWPLVGIHVALLEDGRVLAYDSVRDAPVESHTDHNTTRAIVWNPATGGWTRVDVDTGFNLFCSGAAHLPDGSVFLAGGNKNAAADGIDRTHVFEHAPADWSLGERMATERWYPSVTPLSNGEMLITEGGPTAPDIPEIRGVDGRIRQLAGASMNLAEYPWVDVAPGGWAFVSGPDLTMHAIDTSGSGSLHPLGRRDDVYRDYGSRAMYDVGKVLVTGGAAASDDAEVIDLNFNPATGQRPRVSQTEPMEHGRRQHNLTVLADGSVLATGGISNGTPRVDLEHGVYDAELWDPGTGLWSTLAPMAVTRQYHSTALLLPDGRVLSSGGGICGDCENAGYLAKNAEVFSPPYLFDSDGSGDLAARPRITSAPAGVGFGEAFRVASPDVAGDREARPRPARERHPFGQHGAALRPARLRAPWRRARGRVARDGGDRSTRPLHALRDRPRRRPVRRQHDPGRSPGADGASAGRAARHRGTRNHDRPRPSAPFAPAPRQLRLQRRRARVDLRVPLRLQPVLPVLEPRPRPPRPQGPPLRRAGHRPVRQHGPRAGDRALPDREALSAGNARIGPTNV